MDDDETIRLELLGHWKVSIGGQSIQIGLRQQRLLVALVMHGTRSRRFLAGLLWPKCTESHAQGSLRAAVFTLARRCPGAVMCHGTNLALNEHVDVDLHRLRRILSRSEPFVPSSEEGRWLLDRARVELLPGWYDHWVISEADRLSEDYLAFVEVQARTALLQGNPSQALLLARIARRLDPLRESAVRLQLQGHLDLGNQIDAQHEFTDYCAVLAHEVGAKPSNYLADLLQDSRHA
jgi:DNA-binding SARP family transcriptional activator